MILGRGNDQARARLEQLLKQERARGDRLDPANERLEKKLDEMLKRQEELQQEIRDLVRKLNEALRAAKDQSAPFARRNRKEHRRKAGRKPGHQARANRPPTPPTGHRTAVVSAT